MRKVIVTVAALTIFMQWPHIRTGMTVNGSGGMLFSAIIETAFLLTIAVVGFLAIRQALGYALTALTSGYRRTRRGPKTRTFRPPTGHHEAHPSTRAGSREPAFLAYS
jgi:hypothetical protein